MLGLNPNVLSSWHPPRRDVTVKTVVWYNISLINLVIHFVEALSIVAVEVITIVTPLTSFDAPPNSHTNNTLAWVEWEGSWQIVSASQSLGIISS